jgi:hypothetical protein
MSLEPGSLYIVLKLRSDSLEDKTFHVMLYFHTSDVGSTKPGGTKYHITNLRSDKWLTDHGPESAIVKMFLLNCLVRVAKNIPTCDWEKVDAAMRAKDEEINVDGMNCRVWVVQAMQRLKDAGIEFIGDSVEDMDKESFRIGDSFRASAIMNEQPRPIVDLSSQLQYPDKTNPTDVRMYPSQCYEG